MKFKEFIKEWSHTAIDIRPYLEKKGYKFLGHGADQTAYLEPKTGKILKIFGTQSYSNRNKNGYTDDHLMFKTFVDYCEKHKNNQFLPKFDGWEGFEWHDKKYLQIRMEKLQKLPDALANALEDVSAAIDSSTNKDKLIFEFIKNIGEPENSRKSPIHLNTRRAEEMQKLMVLLGYDEFKLFLQTMADLVRIAEQKHYIYDLHGGNFMHRNDGIPVIVDPWVI